MLEKYAEEEDYKMMKEYMDKLDSETIRTGTVGLSVATAIVAAGIMFLCIGAAAKMNSCGKSNLQLRVKCPSGTSVECYDYDCSKILNVCGKVIPLSHE